MVATVEAEPEHTGIVLAWWRLLESTASLLFYGCFSRSFIVTFAIPHDRQSNNTINKGATCVKDYSGGHGACQSTLIPPIPPERDDGHEFLEVGNEKWSFQYCQWWYFQRTTEMTETMTMKTHSHLSYPYSIDKKIDPYLFFACVLWRKFEND